MIQAQQETKKILVSLFLDGYENPEQDRLKKQSIQRLHETFSVISESKSAEYLDYLDSWVCQQVDNKNLEIFVMKLRELQTHIGSLGNVDLCGKFFCLVCHLLMNDSAVVRDKAIQLIIDMIRQGFGSVSITKTIKTLIISPNNNQFYVDSGFRLFCNFREGFSEGELAEIFDYDRFNSKFKLKKVLSRYVCQLANNFNIDIGLFNILAVTSNILIGQQDEILMSSGLEARISLMTTGVIRNFVKAGSCLEALEPFYNSQLIRVKYIMIKSTPNIVKIIRAATQQFHQQNQINALQNHFKYLHKNINVDEPDLAEIAVSYLKHIFFLVSHESRKDMLNKLLEKKDDVDLEKIIAQNIVDLLLEMNNQSIVLFLNSYLDGQPDQVKIVLMKAFFENEKCKHLFQYFTHIVEQLLQCKKWRNRLEALPWLKCLLFTQPFQQGLFMALYRSIIEDPAYRVRIEAMALVEPYLMYPYIQERLIPDILIQAKNKKYQIRLAVLFFIQKTYFTIEHNVMLRNSYHQVLQELADDAVVNVAQLSRAMIEQLIVVHQSRTRL